MAIGIFLCSFQLAMKGLPIEQTSLHAIHVDNKSAIAHLLMQQNGADAKKWRTLNKPHFGWATKK